MKSMTAYANIDRKKKGQNLQVILRSLNFKYLDISVHNLGAENIILEEKIKREIKKKITRGKIEVYVFLKGMPKDEVFINEEALKHYIFQMKRLAKKYRLGFQ